jgi:hypothetical protein
MSEYRKHYNKTHMPIDVTKPRKVNAPAKANVGLSDAEYENLKKDMTYILTEYFSASLSADKINDVIKDFVSTNIEMLKGKNGKDGVDGKDGYTPRKDVDYFDGKDGYTPRKGVDYYTENEKQELTSFVKQTVVGDIDRALDRIIAIQESLIGGGVE